MTDATMGVRVDVYENPRNPANTAVVEYPTGTSWYVNDEYATLQVHAGNDVIAEYPAGTWARVEAIPAPEVVVVTRGQALLNEFGLTADAAPTNDADYGVDARAAIEWAHKLLKDVREAHGGIAWRMAFARWEATVGLDGE